jgi:hypothetical protein
MSTTEERPVAIEVPARLDGWDVTLRFDLPAAKLGAALSRLATLGYEPRAAAAPGQASKPKRQRAEPVYTPNGDPCCPVHHKPLVEGRYGLYCPSKAAPGEEQNDKGYCALKFD